MAHVRPDVRQLWGACRSQPSEVRGVRCVCVDRPRLWRDVPSWRERENISSDVWMPQCEAFDLTVSHAGVVYRINRDPLCPPEPRPFRAELLTNFKAKLHGSQLLSSFIKADVNWRPGCTVTSLRHTQEDAMTHPRCTATLALGVLAAFGFATHLAGSAQTEAVSSRANAITVNGCMRSADQMAVGTSGSPVAGTSGSRSANDSSTKFVLTNVTSNGSSAETATGAAKAGSAPHGYRLDADKSKLTPHVGHR